jgi:glycosyltransferase involved in cell wall biosynthesis
MKSQSKNIKVSVCMITYNHEKFIKQAIENVLNQVTSFDFELIISNDCSTDSTSKIINNLINNHPKGHKIQYYNQAINLGMHLNGEFVLKKAKGKYIAICEGDDYWTNDNKLQIQHDYLEQDENCGLVHHEVDYLYEKNGMIVKNYKKSKKIKISNNKITENLILQNFISTLSVMFRKELLDAFFEIDGNIRNKYLMSDYFMWLLFSKLCQFKYIENSMATYRVLENSASNSDLYEKKISFLNSYCDIKIYFINKFKLDPEYLEKVNQYKFKELSIIAIKSHRFNEALEFSVKLNNKNFKNIIIKTLTILFNYNIISKKLIKYI